MYTVGVRGTLKILGSLRGQNNAMQTEGPTYDVKVEVESQELDSDGGLVDPAVLQRRLQEVLSELDSRDLSEHPAFEGVTPTVEQLARELHRRLSRDIPAVLGFPVVRGSSLSVTLEDAASAWTRYRAPVRYVPIHAPMSRR